MINGANPREEHLLQVEMVLMYVRAILGMGVVEFRDQKMIPVLSKVSISMSSCLASRHALFCLAVPNEMHSGFEGHQLTALVGGAFGARSQNSSGCDMFLLNQTTALTDKRGIGVNQAQLMKLIATPI
jgi:hypothetical protein